ncbi:unnamed protein product [Rodentolepis nana]|uniref:Uncharacterized protein n=1 Tax=Rodentolepis nana TaxID=102285 RepID=A0A3P7USQ1_RODNA|nr:unnamed protein product [Rodentolepis nana]
MLPLVDIDADVFDGLERFENEFVISFTETSREKSFTLLFLYRHPLPKRYYLTMKPYPDRQTTAVLRNFSNEMNKKRMLGSFENMEARIFQRTINEPCSNNIPMVLKSEPNSFFCTINTPLVTEVFKEFLTDSYVDQKDEKCDKARRICQLCMMQSCGIKNIDWNMRRSPFELASELAFMIQIQVVAKSPVTPLPIVCAISAGNATRWIAICRITANFAFVFGKFLEINYPLCSMWKVRVIHFHFHSGKTLQFTLTPDFDFKNRRIQCHLKRHRSSNNKNIVIDFGFDFTTLGKNQDLDHSTNTNSFHSNSYKVQIPLRIIPERAHNFLGGHFVFHLKENIPDIEEAVLIKNTQADSTNSTYCLVDLQHRKGGLLNNNSIELFRQRDEKYITFQNIKPFQFNTENWHKQGCAVEISDGIAQEQVVENATENVPVTVRIIPPKRQGAPFNYIVHEKDHKIQLHLSAKGALKCVLQTNFPPLYEFPDAGGEKCSTSKGCKVCW